MVEITVPAGERMIVGKANEVPHWGAGSGEQYWLDGRVQSSWYEPSEIIEVE